MKYVYVVKECSGSWEDYMEIEYGYSLSLKTALEFAEKRKNNYDPEFEDITAIVLDKRPLEIYPTELEETGISSDFKGYYKRYYLYRSKNQHEKLIKDGQDDWNELLEEED